MPNILVEIIWNGINFEEKVAPLSYMVYQAISKCGFDNLLQG